MSGTSRSCSCTVVLTEPAIGDMTLVDEDVLSVPTRTVRVPIIAETSWALVRLVTGPMTVAEHPSRHAVTPARPQIRSMSPGVWYTIMRCSPSERPRSRMFSSMSMLPSFAASSIRKSRLADGASLTSTSCAAVSMEPSISRSIGAKSSAMCWGMLRNTSQSGSMTCLGSLLPGCIVMYRSTSGIAPNRSWFVISVFTEYQNFMSMSFSALSSFCTKGSFEFTRPTVVCLWISFGDSASSREMFCRMFVLPISPW